MRWLVAVLLVPAVALGSTARLASLAELTARAELVVTGVAATATARWEGGRIVTLTPVRLDEVWTGQAAAGDIIMVETLGGVVGDVGQYVAGEARLAPGDHLVLFLGTGPRGNRRVLDLAQGAFQVLPSAGNDAPVRRDLVETHTLGAALEFPSTLPELRRAVLDLPHAR